MLTKRERRKRKKRKEEEPKADRAEPIYNRESETITYNLELINTVCGNLEKKMTKYGDLNEVERISFFNFSPAYFLSLSLLFLVKQVDEKKKTNLIELSN